MTKTTHSLRSRQTLDLMIEARIKQGKKARADIAEIALAGRQIGQMWTLPFADCEVGDMAKRLQRAIIGETDSTVATFLNVQVLDLTDRLVSGYWDTRSTDGLSNALTECELAAARSHLGFLKTQLATTVVAA
tara:strand:+ start:309 stop:707 length:399 start_codon:yes stop_codon:yes gene_type:complete